MRFAMRRLLRGVAAGLLASIAATGALVVLSAAPASADSYSPWAYLQSGATQYCLATDWSRNVYTWTGCDGPQRWRFQYLDAYPGTVLLQNQATGLCLKQQDFVHVISASCDGSIVEFRWEAHSGYIYSANTRGWLTTDYTGSVALYNGEILPSNQYWVWTG